MNRNQLILGIFGITVIAAIAFFAIHSRKEIPSATEEYLNKRIDTLLHEVKRSQRLVHDLKVEIELRKDTIRIFERQLPIIRNNYYTNEKEILTNTDSANRVLRINNQMLFERDYFSGRFRPKTK
jgi:hypothetical protein